MVLLMATLFWALWDEDFGQRPWKTFQHEWKDAIHVPEDCPVAVERLAKGGRGQRRLPEAETRLRER